MTEMTAEAIHLLMDSRKERVLLHLDEDTEYKFLCKQQKESEKIVDELYGRFEKSERQTIRAHYESQIELENCRLDEVYIQGLRDGFELVAFLSGRENGVRL